MSTPPPSTPAPEGRNAEISEPNPSAVQPAAVGLQSGPPTLSPLSPEATVELEPLSAGTSDNAAPLAAALPDAVERAGAADKKIPAGKRPKPYRWAVWVVSFLTFGLVATVVGLVYLAIGTVSGTEFDAIAWTTREFRFVRDPLTDTQLTGIKHDSARAYSVDAGIAKHLTGGPARPVHARWDLVRIHRGLNPGEGEALILLRYLQATDNQGKNYWADWTTNHPSAAPILWSAVRDTVHLERYDWLPVIFDRVRVTDDPPALKAALSKVMLDLALESAGVHSKAGDQAYARRAALVGLSYGADDKLQALVDDTAEATGSSTTPDADSGAGAGAGTAAIEDVPTS